MAHSDKVHVSPSSKHCNGIPLEADAEPESSVESQCNLCSKPIVFQEVFVHFEQVHDIPRDKIEAEPTRCEIEPKKFSYVPTTG